MIHINEVPFDYEPRRKILPELPTYIDPRGQRHPEMTESESAFLCGLLKIYRPKKVLEVGVASGGSTAIILQALEDLNESYEMHSIDISPRIYCDQNKTTGFMATIAKEKIFGSLNGTHKFHIGTVFPFIADEIGEEIDFVILDTIHIIPGEILDFLAIFPYLKNNAIIVLHDVAMNQYSTPHPAYYATSVLFSTVTAEKFLNFVPAAENRIFNYPNIAAFKVNALTAENVDNVFLSLILRWIYMPPEEQLVAYRQLYKRFYPAELCEIFQEAIDMNAYNYYLAQRK